VPSAPFVVPPLLLIAILLFSAVAKIRDPADTSAVFAKLDLPGFLVRFKAPALLPYGELAVAAMLLVLPDRWYVLAATLTLLLFLAYFAVVARALTFPYPVLCGCFGQLGLGWITRQTLIRNAVLLAIAAVTWVDSWRGDGVLPRLRDLGEGWWWLAGVAVAIVTTALVAREGKPPRYVSPQELSETYIATPIPYGVLDGPDGVGSVWQLSDAAARLLVFYDPAEADADEVLERVRGWQGRLAPVQVHLVGPGEWSDLSAQHPEVADRLLGDPDGQTRLRLRVFDLPGAVLLGTDRHLAGGPSLGLAEIEELVEAAADEIRASIEHPDQDPADHDHADHDHADHERSGQQQADQPAAQ
jgi:hypothetical protein